MHRRKPIHLLKDNNPVTKQDTLAYRHRIADFGGDVITSKNEEQGLESRDQDARGSSLDTTELRKPLPRILILDVETIQYLRL